MLKRPTRPLPRKFSRPLTPKTRAFVERRHKRARERYYERWRRWVRRWRSAAAARIAASRKWLKYLCAGIAVAVVCVLLFSPILHVREIRVVRDDNRVDIHKILAALAPFYDKHLFFVSARNVSARVREVVPDASDVTVSKGYPSELTVKITLVPLVAHVAIDPPLVAGSGVLAGGGSGAVLADYLTANGELISTLHPETSQTLPTIHIVDWTVRPEPPAALLTADMMDRMHQAEEALTLEFGQQIRTRTVYLRAREFHLATPAVSFWFDLRNPLEQELQRLRTFLATVKLSQVKSYVDLRLSGRVVYK